MRRKLALLFFATSIAMISACTNVAGPNFDDEEDEEPCSVVGGSSTCPNNG